MPRTLQLLEVPTGPGVLDIIGRLGAAMDGSGPVLLPVAKDDLPRTVTVAKALAAGTPMADGEDDASDPTALVVQTSGSTGRPKGVLLPESALRASARATAQRLSRQSHAGRGRPEYWLLALPAQHIAGLQVILRAVAAGTAPVVMDTARSFTAERFLDAVADMPSGASYVSLVPTQLRRILAMPEAGAALATFDAVLVGGSDVSQVVIDEAARAGVRIVTTYGMSETCGGCVYDGVPLGGVTLDVLGPDQPMQSPDDRAWAPREQGEPGRLTITGTVVARGYRGIGRHPAFRSDGPGGRRTFVTDDLGVFSGGRWRVVGRVDDVIVTGGTNVDPARVESALAGVPGVGQAIVTGVPDLEWGARLVAVVAPAGDVPPSLQAVRRAARAALGPTAAPKQLVLVDDIPQLSIGKPDRSAIGELIAGQASLAGGIEVLDLRGRALAHQRGYFIDP